VIVLICLRIHGHYQRAHRQLLPRADATLLTPPAHLSSPNRASDETSPASDGHSAPIEVEHLIVVPVALLDQAALDALAYAASLQAPVLAVHVSPTEEEGKRFQGYWKAWGDYLPLEVVISPYRSTVAPLANYIAALRGQQPGVTLTVIVPEVITAHRWESVLHGRIAQRLRRTLIHQDGIVVTSVPFHLTE
jgi:hypothetical protein